ncbi:MAG: polysaccharide pyruvyl transferase family protein [Chloroflexi bacterium]|nr:polysaccharide pyruvyl transferase family protein [Chloroflexota bacterium]
MSKNIILWGGWYGSKNVGDQALLLAITDLLGSAHLDAQFTVLTANPNHVHLYTTRDSKFNIRALNTRREFPRVVRAFIETDLFVFGGGVPFFDHAPQVLAMFVLTMLARLSCTPYFLWSVSSQKVESKLAKKIFGWILKGADGVTYRDEFTRQLFLDCGLRVENMTVGGDSVILMESDSAESVLGLLARAGWTPGDRPLAALTPRVLRPSDGEAETHYAPKTQEQFQKEIDTYSSVLDWLWEHGYQPIFVPMNTVPPDDDRHVARLIMSHARHGNHALMIDEEVYPRAAAAVYGQCQASLVSRVHGCIMSVKANCPVVMYAFDRKHIGLMQELGLSESIFYPEQDSALAVQMLANILENGDEARAALAEKLTEAGKKSMIPLRQVLEILEKT